MAQVEAKKRNPNIHLSGLEWGVPGWVSVGKPVQLASESADADARATDDAMVGLLSTDECSPDEKVQQWTFDSGAPGQLCNALNQCFNVPHCDTKLELLAWEPSAPGASCVADCGCTKIAGQSCGIGPGKLDCYKNAQFNKTAPAAGFVTLQNAISGMFVQEDPKRETLTLTTEGFRQHALWSLDGKLLKNKNSGRCIGRWQNAPPPPPGPPPPGHDSTTATEENIAYLVDWMTGLKKYKNLTMDSIGVGYNEGGFSVPWMKAAKKAFTSAGLGHVLTIGTDDCCGGEYRVVPQMAADPELNASIDILGAHCTGSQNGQKNPTPDVLALNKPLWNTEQHFGLPDPSPALCWEWDTSLALAQTLNQQYVVANQTSVQMWTPIYSWYEWLPYKGKGLMVANRPWDNTYNVTDTIWAAAHTTQFTERGWYYLGGSASALLPDAVSSLGKTGGSYVTLVSPGCKTGGGAGTGGGCEMSIVIETVGASGSTPIEFTLLSSLAKLTKLSCWTTSRGAVFVKAADVPVSSGKLKVIVPPDSIWTLSTIVGATKGGNGGTGKDQPQKNFPLPYAEDFESYGLDTLPKYFSDMHGAFAVADDGAGKVMRQQASTIKPLSTHGRSADGYSVAIGDAHWGAYEVSVQVMLEPNQNASAGETFFFVGSHATSGTSGGGGWGKGMNPEVTYSGSFLPKGGGALLRVGVDGAWSILSSCSAQSKQQCDSTPASVANGTGLPVAPNKWLAVSLALVPGATGLKIVASVAGKTLMNETVACRECRYGGPAYLGTGFHHASFDNFSVTPM